jgi:hypothetical protein
MEYVVGPVIALLLGMKFTDYKLKSVEDKVEQMATKVTLIEKQAAAFEQEMPKRLVATVAPVAVAVKKLNEQVGI